MCGAGEGSFLIQLRVQLAWDKAAFTRLTEVMLACCQTYDARERRAPGIGSGADTTPLPRWLAEGFRYVSTFVRDWTTPPAWQQTSVPEQDYYDAASERLHMLAAWFFTEDCPYSDPSGASRRCS